MTQNENKGNRFDSVKRWVVSIEAGVEWGRGVGSTYHRLPNLRTHFRDQWNLYFLIWEQKLWYAADPLGFWYEWADGLSGSALILCNLLRCIFGFKKRKAYLPSNGEGILGQMSVSVTPRLIWGVLGYRTQGLFIKVYFVCCLVFCFLVFFPGQHIHCGMHFLPALKLDLLLRLSSCTSGLWELQCFLKTQASQILRQPNRHLIFLGSGERNDVQINTLGGRLIYLLTYK